MLRFNKDFVLVDFEAEDSDAVIQALAGRLHAAGLVEAEYGAATIERERHHATGCCGFRARYPGHATPVYR